MFFSVKMEFKTSEFRPAIIRMHEKGVSKKKIAELLGISRHAVRDAIKRFEETGSMDNFPKRLKACVDAEGGWFE